MKISVSAKFVGATVIVAAVIAILVTVVSVQSLKTNLEDAIVHELSGSAIHTMTQLDRFLFERVSDVRVLTNSESVVGSDKYTLREKIEYLRGVEREKSVYASMSVYMLNGTKIGDTRGLKLRNNEYDKPFFQGTLQGEVYHDPRPVMSSSLGVPVIHFSSQIKNNNGTPVGVLVTRYPIAKINEIVKTLIDVEAGIAPEVDLVDKDGLILFSNHDRAGVLKNKLSGTTIFRKLHDGGKQVETVKEKERIYIGIKQTGFLDYHGQEWTLIIRVAEKQVFSNVDSLTRKAILFSSFLLLLIMPFAFIVGKSISKPIEQLRDAAVKIGAGELDTEVDVKSKDEVGELATAFSAMRQKIKDFNVTMEKKVTEQTHQLSLNITILQKAKEKQDKMLVELQESLAEQKRLEKIKTEFLSVTSHELRTPITPMKAQLQMILGGFFGEIGEKEKESLQLILQNTERLDHLIGDILDISKMESGNMKFAMEKCDMNKLVADAVATLKPKVDDKKITMEVQAETVPDMVLDRDRVTQVILNLINNAIKFTDENGVISLKMEQDEEKVTVHVKDSGIGIAKEDCERIFAPFEQVDSSRSRNYEGTGLGLAICKGIVENHGGKIHAESETGKGSTFIFTIQKGLKEQKNQSQIL